MFWAELGLLKDGEDWLRNIRTQLVVLPGFAIAGPAFVSSLVPSTWLPKLTRYWGLGLVFRLRFRAMGPDDAINLSSVYIHLIGSMAGTLAHIAIESWRGIDCSMGLAALNGLCNRGP